MILGLRTDKPEAELYLFDENNKQLSKLTWQAHRELSDTLLVKIEELLVSADADKASLTAIVAYQGPGSFTGLRIGLSVANTLAYALNIPITAAEGENWQQQSLQQLRVVKSYTPVVPEYGAEANITAPRK